MNNKHKHKIVKIVYTQPKTKNNKKHHLNCKWLQKTCQFFAMFSTKYKEYIEYCLLVLEQT